MIRAYQSIGIGRSGAAVLGGPIMGPDHGRVVFLGRSLKTPGLAGKYGHSVVDGFGFLTTEALDYLKNGGMVGIDWGIWPFRGLDAIQLPAGPPAQHAARRLEMIMNDRV
ncbi:hypothetical protein [Bifidobacterium vespertilionis]|uniref:Uncharacterized protein n=1 Tax=Bifidobacterium vespertilionis TaxID=2562524 RepID=A0A5J5E2N8_9BIFI|nr:hypothetical protein [Bifidobacterium vespertilionis]KAA8819566.1 hypothetical protein EMO90_07990 [Bifidobacterium vespertilionis]KAA8823426.1 hypothetical protein EM848_05640 [Bifidobacterium vespertilionis]